MKFYKKFSNGNWNKSASRHVATTLVFKYVRYDAVFAHVGVFDTFSFRNLDQFLLGNGPKRFFSVEIYDGWSWW